MTPFRRGKAGIFSVYIPTGPGLKQRSTGTTDPRLARRIEAMVQQLADDKDWELLRAVVHDRCTLDELWAAYQVRGLETLRARLNAHDLAEFRERWEDSARRTAPASWDQQVAQVERMTEGLQYVHELTAGVIRDRLAALPVRSGTARHYLYSLSAFCNYLVSHGVMATNPCESRALVPRPKKAGKRAVWRTEDVDQAIINRTEGDVRIALTICAASSADRSTPLAMRVRDVHLLAPGVAPNQAKGIEHRIDLPGTKAAGRARKGVRLEPWAVPILRAAIAGKLPDAPLVVGVSADMLSRHWKVAAAAAKQIGYLLKDTRHSYGCRALLAGYPLWEVSKWLGHTSIAMTADVYVQFDYEVARRVREGPIAIADATNAEGITTPGTTSPNANAKDKLRLEA
jgi:integrase